MAKKDTKKTVKKVDVKIDGKQKELKRGVIIAALDNPYYGNYAFQLALSIKHTAPDVSISLLCNDSGKSHLSSDKLSIFDKILKVNKVAVTSNGRAATLKFKTYLYDVSPYDETIYLDADTLFSPKKSIYDLFNSIPKEVNFTMQNRGSQDLKDSTDEQLNSRFNIWANSLHIKKSYNFKEGKIYNLSSELIYFKKDKEVEKLFKTAQKEYDNIKVQHEDFNGGVPDELPFCIAMIKTGLYPHVIGWRPFYWESFDKKRLLHKPNELYNQYYGVSFGGNFQEDFIKKFYKNLAHFYCNKFGVQYVFPLHNKRSFLPGRHTI